MSRFGRAGKIARTLRPLPGRQLLAQIGFGFRGIRPPRKVRGPVPEFSGGGSPKAFLAGPGHANWKSEGELELLNRVVDFRAGVDWGYLGEGMLWAYHLHQCDHLRVPDLLPARRVELMLDWIRRHPSGIGWDPHPTSLRVLSWGKLLLSPGALELSEAELAEVRGSLVQQIETLDRNLEVRLQANHLLSNLIGVVFGGLLFEGLGADRWLARSRDLERELSRQFPEDGGHQERSPMYHALLVENLLDVLNLGRVRSGRGIDPFLGVLEAVLSRALGAHAIWCHPDGEIALFGDSALGMAPVPGDLLAYGRSLGVVPRALANPGLLAGGGYARLEGGSWTLIAATGAPSPAHQPGHAHCDALSFELSHGELRIVCDTGVYEYLPGTRREIARATRSHATLEVAGAEQAEIWAAHRVGGRPRVEVVSLEAGRRLEATCASWSTPKSVHRRIFSVEEDVLEIRDILEGVPQSVRLTLPLAPGLEPRLSSELDGPTRAQMVLGSGRSLCISLPASLDWRLERHPYYPEFGREIDRACLVGRAANFQQGKWRFEINQEGSRG